MVLLAVFCVIGYYFDYFCLIRGLDTCSDLTNDLGFSLCLVLGFRLSILDCDFDSALNSQF